MYNIGGENSVLNYFYLNVYDVTVALKRYLFGIPVSEFSVRRHFLHFELIDMLNLRFFMKPDAMNLCQ